MKDLTLKQIQLKLNVPQHVLIHLCEKGVITPDVAETKGRGQWRQFSRKNLFEFAVALELRKYQIPVVVTGAIIRLLNAFEKGVQRSLNEFFLPDSLSKRPEIELYIYDGELAVFSIGKKSFLAFDLAQALNLKSGTPKVEKLSALPSDYKSYLTLNLSELASTTLLP